MEQREPNRWRQRPAVAAIVRAGIFCLPIAASITTAWAVQRALPPASGWADRAWHLGILVAVSTLVLLVVDRTGRRLLPLATLLDLSMLFPDRAPSRVRLARDAIRRRPIEEQLERLRLAGADPGAVAREILTLVAALSAHDRPTRGHAERVRLFTDVIAEQMGIPSRDRDLLRWAAILHDIGKLHVPASLLNKPGKPTEEEWATLRAHPTTGAQMAGGLLPWLGEWADVISQHHERFDGGGYPARLSGEQISLGARIVSVADAYDVMTANRPYQRPVSRSAALRELVKHSGAQFDPVVVRAMVAVGGPRLRRAQGALAWLADIPLVASGSVPAASVARAVGAGALATGAAAVGVTAGLLPGHPSPDADVSAMPSGAVATSASNPISRPPGPADASVPVPVSTGPPDSGSPQGESGPGSGGGGGAEAEPTPSGGSGSGAGGSTPSIPLPKADEAVGSVTKVGSRAAGAATKAAARVVSDPAGTVAKAVPNPAGTVADVVSGPADAVKKKTGTVTAPLGPLTGP